MEELQQREVLLRAYIQSRPQNVSELIAIARERLSKNENLIFARYLHAGRDYERFTVSETSLLNSACSKLASCFQPDNGRSPMPHNTLTGLLQLAADAKSKRAGGHWQFLNEDFCRGIAQSEIPAPPYSIARNSVLQIFSHLYQKPISEVARRYSFDKKFEKVVDVYYLTERDIKSFARSISAPCGPKTFQRINEILTTHGLPGLQEVQR